ncbi:MAG: hypothetical protein LUD55_04760 [Oscillospiraceae bacterium]|nr:hypothetical protein [Oscillospiraceae bacterium]
MIRRALPFSRWYFNLLTALCAFALGAYFDLTPYRLDAGSALAASGAFMLAVRVLGGAIFAAIVLALLRAGRDLIGLGRVGWRQMIIIFVLLNAVTALYVATSRTVYVWDGAGYWSVAQNLAAEHLGRAQLREVLQSTISMDYNYLLAWPVSLVMRVFGGSRAVYLFCISNLYTLPALWGLCALAKDKKWGGLIIAGLLPMLVYTGLVGFVDVAACALAVWAYVVYTSSAPAVSRGVFSGALLVGTFLLRRYFFFFAASFGVAALAVKLIYERRRWADFISLFVSCAVCAVYFTPNFLAEKVLGTDYGDIYSAYALGLSSDVKLLLRYFGIVLLVLLFALTVRGLVRGSSRPVLTLSAVQAVVCFAAFVMVQSHGQQHLLLYFPAAAAVLGSELTLPDISPRRRCASALAAAAVFGWCLVPKAQPASSSEISVPRQILPSFVFYGSEREDIDELIALADCVDSLSAEAPKTAVVLASSSAFNSETLTNLRASLNLAQPETQTVIRYQGTVDKRDPFNWNTATADYLIIAGPLQTHLGEENQQVFALLARDVLSGEGVGAAYSCLPESFTISGGVTVYIYERIRDWTTEEYLGLSARLTALYPDYAEQYAAPDWVG